MQATKTVHSLAEEFAAQFEMSQREDGTYFHRTRDGSPDELTDLIREAHAGMFPDDWKYEAIRAALESIAYAGEDADLDDLSHEFADGHVDVYSRELCEWLSSHSWRSGYVDEAGAEFGPAENIDAAIMRGQYSEAAEVFYSVRQSLEELADDER